MHRAGDGEVAAGTREVAGWDLLQRLLDPIRHPLLEAEVALGGGCVLLGQELAQAGKLPRPDLRVALRVDPLLTQLCKVERGIGSPSPARISAAIRVLPLARAVATSPRSISSSV